MGRRLKAWLKSLNPFAQLFKARKDLENLRREKDKLDKELKDIDEKRKKVLYLKQ